MKIYICNAFSLSMTARIPCPLDEDAKEWLRAMSAMGAEIVSAVGHPDTAVLFSSLLNRPVEYNRVSVRLSRDDTLLVGQLMAADGGMVRLAPGTTELPVGATIEWWVI